MIEAMINVCQLVLSPFKGDQFFNSKLVASDMEAVIEVNKKEENVYFYKKDIMEAMEIIMVDDKKEPEKTIREKHIKWRKFMLNKETQNKFIIDFVAQLKSLA